MIVIFHEDTYGGEFLKKLLKNLKNAKVIPKVKIKFTRLSALCNIKIEKQIKALNEKKTWGIILIIDDDRSNSEKVNKERRHIPDPYSVKIELLPFNDEIEELYLFSEGINYTGKASSELKIIFRKENQDYKKRDLPKLVNKLNIEKVIDHYLIKKMIQFIKKCTIDQSIG